MTRPKNLKSEIFLDSGDSQETKQVLEMLGFLDGQTTSPTLIFKNPQAPHQNPRTRAPKESPVPEQVRYGAGEN